MKFTISTSDMRIFISVLWYIETLKNDNKHFLYLHECIYYNEKDNKIVDFVVYDNELKFVYENETINFKRIKYGKPIFINSRCEAGNYEEITLELIDSELSDEKKIKLMKEFFLESKEKYDENRRCKSSSGKMKLWSYSNGFWEEIKRINKRDFDTVILDPSIKQEIQISLDRYNNEDYKKKLKSFGINHKMNLILSGLPGTGKSSLMFSIATMLDKDIATLDFNDKDLSDHSFINALNRIPKDCLFILEDIDALYVDRDKSRDNSVSFSCILNFLDGVYSKEDLVTIITTNHINNLDKAIIRPMRVDKIIKFTYCSKYQYETIFNIFFPEKKELVNKIYKIIKNKKYTTSMLQNWFIKFIYEPDELLNNIAYFEELIDVNSDKDYHMFT